MELELYLGIEENVVHRKWTSDLELLPAGPAAARNIHVPVAAERLSVAHSYTADRSVETYDTAIHVYGLFGVELSIHL